MCVTAARASLVLHHDTGPRAPGPPARPWATRPGPHPDPSARPPPAQVLPEFPGPPGRAQGRKSGSLVPGRGKMNLRLVVYFK